MEEGILHITIQKSKNGLLKSVEDLVAVEAPLEIQIQHFGEEKPTAISVTMRTPGEDDYLALGFLFTEGLVTNYKQIKAIKFIGDNIVKVYLSEGFKIELQKVERNFYTTSSCGVCGKASIEAIQTNSQYSFNHKLLPSNEILFSLKDKIVKEQSLFSLTGGIHAAALFSADGELLQLMEDVGRHNALDKLIGSYLKQDKLPLDKHILLLSGRASFELIQKATMAGIKTIVAVGAASSLAVELAKENGQTLIGFLKETSYNQYS